MTKTLLVAAAMLAFLFTPLGRTREATPDITGRWHFVFDTPGGDREFDTIFVVTAEKVTGKWAVNDKGDGTEIAGSYKEKDMVLEFPYNSDEAGPGTMKLKGHLQDDGSLTGDWSFSDYSGTYKATRVKAEAAPAK